MCQSIICTMLGNYSEGHLKERGNANFTFFVTLVVHLKVEQRDQSYLEYVDKCHSVGLAVSCSSW